MDEIKVGYIVKFKNKSKPIGLVMHIKPYGWCYIMDEDGDCSLQRVSKLERYGEANLEDEINDIFFKMKAFTMPAEGSK